MSDEAPTAQNRLRPGAGTSGQLEVLEAACKVFAAQGYLGTSMDDIADALGATKGRVYHYYRSKLDILLDASTLGLEELTKTVREITEEKSLGPEARVYEMAKMHAAAMMDNPSFMRAWIEGLEAHATRDATGAQLTAWEHCIELRDQYEEMFAETVREGQSAGTFGSGRPRILTKGVLGALNWIHVWYSPRANGSPSAEEIAEEIAVFIVRGLRDSD